MATDPLDTLHPPPEAPLAGTRSQAMQRLQIGLFGLAAMILLVSLANIILTNARQNEARVVPEAAPTVAAGEEAAPVSDPLAQAGVVPDMPHEVEAEAGDAAPALQP
jgi:hypothetical protein